MKPEHELGALLTRLGLTLAVAESCTGGLVAHRITNVSGSSNYFERGFVAYSNRSKTELLGVRAGLIRKHGAVSRPVACSMAAGAKKAAGASVGLGVTGIAGPTGGGPKKPVGLVYIAVCAPDGSVRAKKYNFKGTRLQVKRQSAEAALELLIQTLKR